MCPACQKILAEIIDEIHFRKELSRDTTNSRFAIIKAAIKRRRFGDPNISVSEILKSKI
jgi:hypothetical protein